MAKWTPQSLHLGGGFLLLEQRVSDEVGRLEQVVVGGASKRRAAETRFMGMSFVAAPPSLTSHDS